MKQNASVLGIDLAKRIFHLVGMDDTGQVVLRKCLTRDALMPYIAQLPVLSANIPPVHARETERKRFLGAELRVDAGVRSVR
jgi:hypothetical protein